MKSVYPNNILGLLVCFLSPLAPVPSLRKTTSQEFMPFFAAACLAVAVNIIREVMRILASALANQDFTIVLTIRILLPRQTCSASLSHHKHHFLHPGIQHNRVTTTSCTARHPSFNGDTATSQLVVSFAPSSSMPY